MPNGTLYQAHHQETKGEKHELDWIRRYQIALGAAKGIVYLRHDCTPAIIHIDIKSSTILVDKDYDAKIADFGIAKIAGGHGYVAPELAYSLRVTEKSDVYSFGVVLLELLSAHWPQST